MSRHAFGEILKNEAALVSSYKDLATSDRACVPRDIKGYRLDEWMDYAIVGWDEPIQSYFLQCGEDDEGGLAWWFGTVYAEIPTFAELCWLIRVIFKNSVEFEFVDRIDKTDEFVKSGLKR